MKTSMLVRVAVLTAAAMLALAGCSTNQSQPAPANPTATVAQSGDCKVNPQTSPMPTTEQYRPVAADARISVTMDGVPSGTVQPGDAPAEVTVTLCNDSPVDYPAVGLTTVLTKCSCAINPMGLPEGRVERLDAATGDLVPLKGPVITTGMDFLGGFTDVQPLPKGKTVTMRYRFTLDPSMTAGKGSLETIAVVPEQLVEIGKADLPFTVLKSSPKDTAPPPDSAAATDRQSNLAFTGLTYPDGIAVADNGDLYLADSDRVVELAAGSTEQTVLPFTGIKNIGDVAVDSAGNVYATDGTANRVLKLTAGSNEPTALPFTGLDNPWHLAVDKDDNVYVTDQGRRVVRLAAGSNEQSVVPFTGLQWPSDVAVDGTGAVYASDSPSHRILKMPAGSTEQTEMSAEGSGMFTVSAGGDLYLSDDVNRQVLEHSAGSTDTTALPLHGLNGPHSVAVDGAGNVYVIDYSGFGRVVKLAAPTVAMTRQACELLTPDVAKKYAGEDAQREFAYDATPPVPVADNTCYYKGATREVEVSVFPRPTDPTAPVNHFNVIRPDNRVHAVDFEAYWFGPGESIVAVKDGMLIGVKVAQIKGSWTDQDRAADVELANLVVPRFG